MNKSTGATEVTILFARQPIYDRQHRLAGCELLFRPCPRAEALTEPFDGDLATRQVILNAFRETDIRKVCENTPAYINFTANALRGEIPFDPGDIVIEILETVEATDEVVAAIEHYRQRRYAIALDDYRLTDAGHPLLPFADIVKLDYPHYGDDELPALVTQLRHRYPYLKILAEKIETLEDFLYCREAGCDLFQGYYLARPSRVERERLSEKHFEILQLLAELNRVDASQDELAETIGSDDFLEEQLLGIVNSTHFDCREKITSVAMAIDALGQRRIRNLASMLALAKLDDKPCSLQKLALDRGELCQGLADNLAETPISGFTVGLFSILDAFFQRSLDEIFDSLPLPRVLKEAVLEHRGPMGLILATTLHLEQGELEDLDWAALAEQGLTPEQVSHAQQQAIENSDMFF
ncbi:EAL and modified HD-GYP domain-containing signal transduction protein [Modicisalibacter ilicicola DSM 19980]|uniref:EAL and modified HD-GYP domain-containing signal transduction protein n=1 Tax=Modicisalibacter ilicicola DSM 19980 TaxID=1121942 RepID=A0A1M5B5J0_9GAMM|nr:HDOD domain-containing protein [Halomonas ilicicola]SHF37831.1 EAL and modified HD-GYP domain-containing signal transduction protein [Halomonas ilicicola DSM 19980]